MADKKPITVRQARALHEMVMKGEPPMKALKNAGYKPVRKEAAAAIIESIKRKYIDANGGLLVALEDIGVDLEKVAATMKDGLEATNKRKIGKSFVDVPDHQTRHRYLETTLGVMGAKAAEKHVVENINKHEHTIEITESIRDNPALLDVIRRKLEERNRTVDITPEEE